LSRSIRKKTQVVSISIPKELLNAVDETVKRNPEAYISRSDFIREAVKHMLEEKPWKALKSNLKG